MMSDNRIKKFKKNSFKKLSKYFFKLVLSLINTLNPKIFDIIIDVRFD